MAPPWTPPAIFFCGAFGECTGEIGQFLSGLLDTVDFETDVIKSLAHGAIETVVAAPNDQADFAVGEHDRPSFPACFDGFEL